LDTLLVISKFYSELQHSALGAKNEESNYHLKKSTNLPYQSIEVIWLKN